LLTSSLCEHKKLQDVLLEGDVWLSQQVRLWVFYDTFNNTSVLWWKSVSLMEETGVSGKIIDRSEVTDKLVRESCNMCNSKMVNQARP